MGSYDYAGCLSVPRLLHLRGDRLIQEPVPEVSNLRRGQCWKTRHLSIQEEEMTPLEGLRGSSLDIEVVLDRSVSHVFPGVVVLCTGSAPVVRLSIIVSKPAHKPYCES